MKTPSVKLNSIVLSKEQMKTVRKNMFSRECDKFFKQIKSYSLNSNIYLFGHLTSEYAKDGVNDFQAKTILGHIKKLLSRNSCSDNINLVNIIFSTLLKRITPENIISGIIKSETYRRIIDESIRIYKSYPLAKGVDYRHILGRMVSLKDMCTEVHKRIKKATQDVSAVEWTQYDQLELVNTLERIFSQKEQANSSFVFKRSKLSQSHKKYADPDMVKHNYYNSIIKLLWMLRDSSSIMLKNPERNADDIRYNMELAYYYADKIPLQDSERMAKVWKVKAELAKIEKKLLSKTQRKHS